MFEADNNGKDGEKKKGFWDKVKGAAKGALDKLKGAWNITKQLTGQFSKDMLNKWRNAHYEGGEDNWSWLQGNDRSGEEHCSSRD